MATENNDISFEDIDWDAQSTSTFSLSKQGIAEAGCYLLIVALFAYDYAVIENAHPLIWNWDVLSVEWLFAATFVALLFHIVLPLYKNERMRQFYWRRFKKNRIAVIALVYLAVVFVIGILGPLVVDPPQVRFTNRILPPVGVTAVVDGVAKTGTWQYPLGTSAEGRGILALVVYGMRVSMEVGLVSTIIAVFIGSLVGSVAALATATDIGWMDEVLMRYTDIQSVFPVFILLLLLVYLFGAELWMIIALYGFFGWEGIARTVRGEALQRSSEAYIKAARASGANMLYIVRTHLIPNSANSVIISASVLIPGFILGEATLAFLGFSDPSTFSWGRTISAGQANIEQAWWISTIPGLFLFFTVLSFYYVGEAMRDAMDPRQEIEGGGGL
ncbi:ABC-type dipeptide/oligopeptide/nickel transport system, permease component [Halogeometricum borinquense DSM 11551]|uniref:ABC-type dipeptide/oligopeptide/nickel transport system, permease component n=2 Tax=Halogeometricum borinquense TaxID=60847 RepID=E4NU24_HALBP|nr:ABC transporter permease [Halogeometricum borinquense]ADQ68544.1 ABC-type dipeptide/oligopeptide/nickel transport system, permease component [Halogeometricum borinquense DSM 11551]ELY25584.1 ABC-type dipeptide/oligopeptide/nickel transport system, permease component [Halogeometricum borinquense DSM 11551]RYJ08538.1 ABC transporter permease [Halogeometricum borinquense]